MRGATPPALHLWPQDSDLTSRAGPVLRSTARPVHRLQARETPRIFLAYIFLAYSRGPSPCCRPSSSPRVALGRLRASALGRLHLGPSDARLPSDADVQDLLRVGPEDVDFVLLDPLGGASGSGWKPWPAR